MDVFVSVGTGLNPEQEAFVSAIEARLRAEGLNPRSVGRNTFSAAAPLRAVIDLMDRCEGTVVIALERYRFPNGLERAGSEREKELVNFRLPTSWNQIEAAMAYFRGHPLLVLLDATVAGDGLLEPGYDWFVQRVTLSPTALNTPEFNGVMTDWRQRLQTQTMKAGRRKKESIGEITISELLGNMRPKELWALIGALATILAGAFALGAHFFGS